MNCTIMQGCTRATFVGEPYMKLCLPKSPPWLGTRGKFLIFFVLNCWKWAFPDLVGGKGPKRSTKVKKENVWDPCL